MPREILIDWSTPAGTASRSVLFFDTATSVADQRGRLKVFLDTIKSQLDNAVTWTIEQAGRDLDDETGILTNVWSDSAVATGVGVVNGEPVADATQVLVRWNTPTIFGGTFLRGRTYIPGLSTSNLSNGNVAAATISAWSAAAETFADSGSGFGVWHRPIQSAGGFFSEANSGSVWSELAVLRRRRA